MRLRAPDMRSRFPAQVVCWTTSMLLLRPQTLLRLNPFSGATWRLCKRSTHWLVDMKGKKEEKNPPNSLMTQIRLGSQEFPDRRKERSFLCVHASLNLQVRMTTLLLFLCTISSTSVNQSLALRASVISNNALNILFHYSLVLSSWTNTGGIWFSLCSLWRRSNRLICCPIFKHRVYLRSNYKQQTSQGSFC